MLAESTKERWEPPRSGGDYESTLTFFFFCVLSHVAGITSRLEIASFAMSGTVVVHRLLCLRWIHFEQCRLVTTCAFFAATVVYADDMSPAHSAVTL